MYATKQCQLPGVAVAFVPPRNYGRAKLRTGQTLE